MGVATGAAWTSTGGEIMFLEVNLMPGKGQLTLTGQLGDVMQESAQAAPHLYPQPGGCPGLDPDVFDKTDIHIHVPEGAVPKDGPLRRGLRWPRRLFRPLRAALFIGNVCMTVGGEAGAARGAAGGRAVGEGVGGAAAGIETFILPQKNERDLEEIPKRLRQDVKFVLAKRMEDVLQVVLSEKA
ncbi:MAG: hypothetical protein M5U34_15725 [Chloroflexi bacterium]|nr:hypothetical protein [Chloroflexota bacterium]